MKPIKRGIHIFGIIDDAVVLDILAQVDDSGQGLDVQVTKKNDVNLVLAIETLQGIVRSLNRLVNNPASLEIYQQQGGWTELKGDIPPQ